MKINAIDRDEINQRALEATAFGRMKTPGR
jgi:hypothetical protein